MVASDWGDWLPREIESVSPDGLFVWYLGCNGIAVKSSGGTIIYIDPYLGTGDPPRTIRMIPVPFGPTDVSKADAILATHEHSDHVHGPTQGPMLKSTDATYVGPDAALDVVDDEGWQDEWALAAETFTAIEPGAEFDVGDLTITVTEANDPDAIAPVGYLIEHEAGTIFHGGDARPGEAFEAVGANHDIDLGILAFGTAGMILDKETRQPKYTKWYSDENQIIEAANQLQLDRLLPTHWDMWKGLTADPRVLSKHANSFDYPGSIVVREIGDRISL